jgi:CSLREA domain-containing protein
LECRQLLAVFVVDALDDDSNDDLTMSLREAIDLANAEPNADVIEFSDELAGGTIVLRNGEIGRAHV